MTIVKACDTCMHQHAMSSEPPCNDCCSDGAGGLTKWQPAEVSAMTTQVDGNHYIKFKIQPLEYSMANNLDACQHSIVKYVTRFRDKNGLVDLEKARDVLDKLIHFHKQEIADGKAEK